MTEVGIGTFETQLRSNFLTVLSDTLYKALLGGSGSSNEITGIINARGAPAAEATTETWSLARNKIEALMDGIWVHMWATCQY